MSPLLEEAMLRLGQTDRDALVLRFFEGRSLNEVGAALGASEDAAKKRVNRAVEKLRAFFTRREIVLPAAVMTAAISANSVQAAPVALAKTVTAVAIAKGAAASGSTLTLIKGALKIMAWSKMKTAIVLGASVVLLAGIGAGTAQQLQEHQKRSQEQQLQQWQKTIPGEALKFLLNLHTEGQLPGISKSDHGSFIFGNIKNKADALKLLDQINHYPFSLTFDSTKSGDKTKSKFHYTVVKVSETDAWHLQKAWRTDASDRVVEEFPIP